MTPLPTLRFGVLSSRGEGRAFCAGQDLKEVTSKASPGFQSDCRRNLQPEHSTHLQHGETVIAAVNGVAAGAGANIALACDFVIAKSSATFIQAFANIGLIPDSGGTFWLPRLVGIRQSADHAGKPLSAKDAESMGLIYKAVDDNSWSSEVNALSNTLANMPTRGLGLTKSIACRPES